MEEVKKYLEEIYNDENLLDAFYNCDIEIYDEKTCKDVIKEWDERFG